MKTCPFCAEEIQGAATICRYCRADVVNMQPAPSAASTTVVVQAPAQRWSPGVAAVLSFFLPGVGQIYKGQILNGLVWMFFVAAGYVCFIIPGLVLHLCCVIGAASGNPNK